MNSDAITALNLKAFDDWIISGDSTALEPSILGAKGRRYVVHVPVPNYVPGTFETPAGWIADTLTIEPERLYSMSSNWIENMKGWFNYSDLGSSTLPAESFTQYLYSLLKTSRREATAADYSSLVRIWAAEFELQRAIQGIESVESADDEAYFDALDLQEELP